MNVSSIQTRTMRILNAQSTFRLIENVWLDSDSRYNTKAKIDSIETSASRGGGRMGLSDASRFEGKASGALEADLQVRGGYKRGRIIVVH